jgi:hypothetical protein
MPKVLHLIVGAVALFASGTAEAGLIRVEFAGTVVSPGAGTNTVFNGNVSTITGAFVYRTDVAPTPFSTQPTFTSTNYFGAVHSFEFALNGITGSAVKPQQNGYVQVFDSVVSNDRFSVNNVVLPASLIEGEASFINNIQFTAVFNGPLNIFSSSSALPEFDADDYTGQKILQVFASSGPGRPAGTKVSGNFNLQITDVFAVPEPSALALFGAGLAGAMARRRFAHRPAIG